MFADQADAEGEDQAREGRALAPVEGGEDVVGQLVAHTLQRQQLLFGQKVQVPGVFDEALLHQLQNVLVAEPLDVQGAARDEVDDALGGLGGAAEAVGAAGDGLALRSDQRGSAGRAMTRQFVRLRAFRALGKTT